MSKNQKLRGLINMKKYLLSGMALTIVSLAVYADMFDPTSLCYKPSKPFQFNSQWEADSWADDVSNYKRCISNFIDEQNEAAANHQRAANAALNEWNRFVQYELN
jgi:hypothetical protein